MLRVKFIFIHLQEIRQINCLHQIFEIYYELKGVSVNPFYCTFKSEDEITFGNVESIIYDIENILKDSKTLYRLDELTSDFNKNKFLKYSPKQDCVELKNHVLFDSEGLIDVIRNNNFLFISNCPFRTRFLNFDYYEDDLLL